MYSAAQEFRNNLDQSFIIGNHFIEIDTIDNKYII